MQFSQLYSHIITFISSILLYCSQCKPNLNVEQLVFNVLGHILLIMLNIIKVVHNYIMCEKFSQLSELQRLKE